MTRERTFLAAAVQLDSREDVAANLESALALLGEAASRGARLVALPENFLYIGPDTSLAFDLAGPELAAVSDAAARLGLYVLAGSVQERSGDGDPRHHNTSLLLGPDGVEIARYRKIHLFDVELPDGLRYLESGSAKPGSETVAVETLLCTIGLAVCYDLRFPELFRRLAAAGAQLVTVPSNFTLQTGRDHWEVLLRARAIENQTYVIAPGQIGEKHGGKASFGRSLIVDPWGTVLAVAPDRPNALALAEIDLDHLERIRSRMPVLRHARLGALPKGRTMMIRVVWLVALLMLLAAGLAVGFLVWAAAGRGSGEAVLVCPVEVVEAEAGSARGGPPAGRPTRQEPPGSVGLRVMSFNIAYCRGPEDDRGDLRDRETVERYLRRVAGVIRNYAPDMAALQEVDFDSHRTHGIDEARELALLAGLPYLARVSTWENNYVPWPYWPPAQQYGRMHSGQCVLSRFPIRQNVRHRLAQPSANPWWFNLFYLHRAVQVVDLDVDGRAVRVFNTHLEAFDRPNREDQARFLADLYSRERVGAALVLGDMNAVPPEASRRSGFSDEPGFDGDGDSTVPTLRSMEGLSEIIPAVDYLADEASALTFPAEAPSRRLDYLFFSTAFTLVAGRVYREAGSASDHLPLAADLAFAQGRSSAR